MSKETLGVRIPTAKDVYTPLIVDIIKIDLPFLIGLNYLEKNELLLKYLDDKLEQRPFNQSYPVEYKQGHLFLECDLTNVFFTLAELQRMHLRFLHPTTDKLFQLLKRVRSTDAYKGTKKTLKAIAKSCEQCQELSVVPFRFRASIPSDQLHFKPRGCHI